MFKIIEIKNKDGSIIARDAGSVIPAQERLNGLNRYTAFISWDEDRNSKDASWEEIDVDAINRKVAKQCVEEILKAYYNPKWKHIVLEQRFGLYF